MRRLIVEEGNAWPPLERQYFSFDADVSACGFATCRRDAMPVEISDHRLTPQHTRQILDTQRLYYRPFGSPVSHIGLCHFDLHNRFSAGRD